MPRKRNRLVTTAVLGLIIVLFILASFWLGQRRLMYYPDLDVPAPASVGLSDAEPVAFKTTDDITLNGWFLPARSEPPVTVVVFNGNAGNRAYRADIGERLRARGLSVLLFDYRGFGENAGTPTESGLTLDARAARDYLLARPGVSLDRLVYFGESLGSAVATKLAAEQAPAALILRSPFTSFVDLGRIHFPLLPVRWLLRDRFAPIDQITNVRCPVLVVAGTRDAIVPYEQSNRVFEAAVSTKKLVTIEGADHNDEELVSSERVIDAAVAFLDANRLLGR
jgi:fermentation-respiration switch protein FrsA (DUF1100 family)